MNRFILSILLLLFVACHVKAQTIEQLRDSMAAGNLNCQVDLACKYIEGDGVLQDHQEAYRLIKDAADKGNRYGELLLGICYHDGIGVEKDLTKAFRWFQSSAEKGNKVALSFVGQAYEFGYGVEQNIKEAVKYYQKASDENYTPALVNLAVCYEHGRGVEQDWEKSFSLLKQACDEGNEGAHFLIAKYYFNGWGTKEDKDEALRIMNSLKEGSFGKEAAHYAAIIEKGDTMNTYQLQFRYIPSILWSYKNGEADYIELVDPARWEWNLRSLFVSQFEWDWHQITPSIHSVADSTSIVLFRMEEPKRYPLCLYMAVVIDKAHDRYEYYTLEKSISLSDEMKDPWVIGGVNEEMSHLNYGFIDGRISEEKFIDKIIKLRSKKK
ncbi:MAG: sel1 repeat family protein [Prevotella sp.]|nr:sel1 repeat family protein [Prevotella sp.]